MLFFFRKRPAPDPDDILEESWKTGFKRTAGSRFVPESGDGYTVSVGRGAVELRLHKRNLFAWAEDPLYRYRDLSLCGTFSFPEAAYASAGFVFRYVDASTFYYCLVSNRGHFRLDGVFNGSPFTLIPWTPSPETVGSRFSLRVVALDTRILVAVDETWAAEIEDDRIGAGRIGFACQNYDESDTAMVRMHDLDLDSRPVSVAAFFERWSGYIPVDPAARIRLAESLFAVGQPLGAVIQLKKALREAAPSAETLLLLGESLNSLGLHEEAFRALEKAEALAPNDERILVAKGNLLYLRNEFGKLAATAERLRALYPENHLAWNLSGHGAYYGGDWGKAQAYYQEAWKRNGSIPLYAVNAARAAVMAGNTDDGLRLYEEAGAQYFRDEAYGECADIIAAAEKIGTLSPVLLGLKGKLLFHEGKLEEAAKIFRRCEKLSQPDSSITFLLGLCLCTRGDRTKGISCLRKAAEMDGDVAVYWYKLAENLYLAGKNPDEALERAVELSPHDCWVHNLLGLRERDSGRGTGFDSFRRAFELCPEEPDILVNYSQALFDIGRTEEAFATLERGKDVPAVRNQKGNLLYAAGRYEEALAEYETALRGEPGNRTYLENAADAALRCGLFSRAEALYARLLEETGDPSWCFQLGSLALKKGEYQRAEAAFREALARDAENPRYRIALARLLLTRGGYEEARGLLDIPADSPYAGDGRDLLDRIERETEDRVTCALCGRIWRVPKSIGSQEPVVLHGEPSGESPAGQCPECGRIFCVSCSLPFVQVNRFFCDTCNRPLKLSDPKLRYLARAYAGENSSAHEGLPSVSGPSAGQDPK